MTRLVNELFTYGSSLVHEYIWLMGHLRDKWFNYYVRMCKTSPCTAMSIFHAVFCGDRTQWVLLSATQKTAWRMLMAVQGDVFGKLRRPSAHGGTPAS